MRWISLVWYIATMTMVFWLTKLSTMEEPLKKIVRVVYAVISVLFLLVMLGILRGGGPIITVP